MICVIICKNSSIVLIVRMFCGSISGMCIIFGEVELCVFESYVICFSD